MKKLLSLIASVVVVSALASIVSAGDVNRSVGIASQVTLNAPARTSSIVSYGKTGAQTAVQSVAADASCVTTIIQNLSTDDFVYVDGVNTSTTTICANGVAVAPYVTTSDNHILELKGYNGAVYIAKSSGTVNVRIIRVQK